MQPALAGHITNPQSLNRYAYVLNNPTTFTDPLGLDSSGYNGAPPQNMACNAPVIYGQICESTKHKTYGSESGSGCMAGEYGCGGSMDSGSFTYGEDIFDALAGDSGTKITVDTLGNIGFTVSTAPVLVVTTLVVDGDTTKYSTEETGPPGFLQDGADIQIGTDTLPTAASNGGFTMGYPGNPDFRPSGFVCVTCGPWTDGGTFPPKAASPAPKPPATGRPALFSLPGILLPISAMALWPVPSSP